MNEDFVYKPPIDTVSFDHSGLENQDDDRFDFQDEDLSLGFIKFIGTTHGGLNEYEFIFTISPDEFWGSGFEFMPASICSYLEPDSKYVSKVVKIKMQQELDLIQNNGCFSMQDCMDGAVALGVQSLRNLDEYPEYRLIFHFGEKYEDVEDKLARCHILILD